MKYVKGTAANNFWLDQWDTTPDANLPASVCSSSGLSGQIWEALQSSQNSLFTTTLWFSSESSYKDGNAQFTMIPITSF